MDAKDEALFTRLPYQFQASQRVMNFWRTFKNALYVGIQLPTVNLFLERIPKKYVFLFVVLYLYALIYMAYTLYRSRGKDIYLSSVILLHPKTIVAFNKTMFVLIILTLYLFILYVIRRSIFWKGSSQHFKLQSLPLLGNHIKLLIWLPMQQIHELIEFGKHKSPRLLIFLIS